MSTKPTAEWLECVFTLEELLSLTEDEFCQLDEIRGDLSLTAAWWRRRRAKDRRDNPTERSA
jgi:hypothetical protein